MMGELCLSELHLTEELILHNPQRLQYSACYNSSPLLSLSLFVSLSNVQDEQLCKKKTKTLIVYQIIAHILIESYKTGPELCANS